MNCQRVYYCVFLLRELLAKRQMNFCMYLFERIKYIQNMSSPSLHMFKTLCTVLHCEIKYLLKELKITQSHFLSVFSSQQIA